MSVHDPGLKIERKVAVSTVITMEKSIRTSVVMSSDSTILPAVAAVLSLRASIPGTVSAETQQKIANLRGILDSKTLASARNGGDWRKGAQNNTGSQGSEPRWRNNNNNNNNNYNGNNNNQRNGNNYNGNNNNQRNGNGFMRNNGSTNPLSNNSTPVTSPSPTNIQTPKAPYTGPPLGRYQSRFKNSSEPIEEKILNRIIRLKLNKFGPSTYTEIRDFLYQILGQESVATEDDGTVQAEEGQVTEFVRDFMLMVFKKAAAEETYCPLYAKLLSEIGAKHSVIFEEMNSLYMNFMTIFEEADVNVASGDMASFEKKNVEKKFRQGYSQFIAELTTLEILSLDSLASTFYTLFQQMDKYGRVADNKPLIEEYVDCILRMSRVMKDKTTPFFQNARSKLYTQNKDILDSLINVRDSTYPSISPKARFLLMDILDILSV